MNRFIPVLSLIALAAIVVSVIASDDNRKKPEAARKVGTATEKAQATKEEDTWMQAKLKASQDIFAGLTRGDLETVKQRARGMLTANILENWLRKSDFTKKSAYQGQLNAFEYANKEIIRHAEDGDIDGTLEAWIRLSRSCVECHKVIRDPAKS